MMPPGMPGPGGPGGPGGEDEVLDSKGERLFFSRDAMMHNHKSVDRVRTFLTLVMGFVAGILGCTGAQGMLLYAVSSVATSVTILAVNMKFDSKKYINMPPLRFMLTGVDSNGALSYILFWTLAYALVHIY